MICTEAQVLIFIPEIFFLNSHSHSDKNMYYHIGSGTVFFFSISLFMCVEENNILLVVGTNML